MSPPVPLGYAESGDGAEPEKDRTQKKVTRTPEEACAEERHHAEQNKVARFSVHSRPRMEASAHPTHARMGIVIRVEGIPMLAIRITGNRKRIRVSQPNPFAFFGQWLAFLDNHLCDLCLGLHSLPYSSPMSTTWSSGRAAGAFFILRRRRPPGTTPPVRKDRSCVALR
jgi:hypothetical protein